MAIKTISEIFGSVTVSSGGANAADVARLEGLVEATQEDVSNNEADITTIKGRLDSIEANGGGTGSGGGDGVSSAVVQSLRADINENADDIAALSGTAALIDQRVDALEAIEHVQPSEIARIEGLALDAQSQAVIATNTANGHADDIADLAEDNTDIKARVAALEAGGGGSSGGGGITTYKCTMIRNQSWASKVPVNIDFEAGDGNGLFVHQSNREGLEVIKTGYYTVHIYLSAYYDEWTLPTLWVDVLEDDEKTTIRSYQLNEHSDHNLSYGFSFVAYLQAHNVIFFKTGMNNSHNMRIANGSVDFAYHGTSNASGGSGGSGSVDTSGLESQIDANEAAIAALGVRTTAVEAFGSRITALEAIDVATLQADIDANEEDIADVVADVSAASVRITNAETVIDAVEARTTAVEAYGSRIEELEDAGFVPQSEITRLDSSLSTVEMNVASLTTRTETVEAYNARITALEAVDHVTDADIDAVEALVATAQAKADGAATAASENAADITAVEERLTTLEGTSSDCSEITRLEGLISTAQTKADEAMTKANDSSSAFNTYKTATDETIADINGDIGDLYSLSDSASEETVVIHENITAIKGRLDALEADDGGSTGGGVDSSEVTRLEGLITAAQAKADAAKDLADENFNSTLNLETSLDEEIFAVKGLITTAQSKADGADTKATENASDVAALEVRVEALETADGGGVDASEITRVEGLITANTNAIDAVKVRTTAVEAFGDRISAMESTTSVTAGEIVRVSGVADAAKATAVQAEAKSSSNAGAIKTLENRVVATEGYGTRLETIEAMGIADKFADLESRTDDVEAEAVDFESRISVLEAGGSTGGSGGIVGDSDVARLDALITAMDTAYKAADTKMKADISDLDVEQANLDYLHGTLKTRVDDMQADVAIAKSKADRVEQTSNTNKAAISDLQEDVATVEGSVAEFDSRISTAEGLVSGIDGRVAALEAAGPGTGGEGGTVAVGGYNPNMIENGGFESGAHYQYTFTGPGTVAARWYVNGGRWNIRQYSVPSNQEMGVSSSLLALDSTPVSSTEVYLMQDLSRAYSAVMAKQVTTFSFVTGHDRANSSTAVAKGEQSDISVVVRQEQLGGDELGEYTLTWTPIAGTSSHKCTVTIPALDGAFEDPLGWSGKGRIVIGLKINKGVEDRWFSDFKLEAGGVATPYAPESDIVNRNIRLGSTWSIEGLKGDVDALSECAILCEGFYVTATKFIGYLDVPPPLDEYISPVLNLKGGSLLTLSNGLSVTSMTALVNIQNVKGMEFRRTIVFSFSGGTEDLIGKQDHIVIPDGVTFTYNAQSYCGF